MQATKLRLILHSLALVLEFFGTVFIFLDVLRMNARFPSEPPGVLGTFGDPLEYRVWYYHRATFGFALLFSGIFLGAICLWLEHAHIARGATRSKPPSPAPPPEA